MTRIALIIGAALMATGLWGILTRRNLIRMVLSLAVAETGLHLVITAVGYVRGGTAPILDEAVTEGSKIVDPLPQALVLTAIVIGVAVNALLLALIIRLYSGKGSLDVEDYEDSRW